MGFLSNKKQKGTKTQGHFGSFFMFTVRDFRLKTHKKGGSSFLLLFFFLLRDMYNRPKFCGIIYRKRIEHGNFGSVNLANRYRRKPTIIIIFSLCVCVFRWPERYWKFSERPKLDSGVQAKPEKKKKKKQMHVSMWLPCVQQYISRANGPSK